MRELDWTDYDAFKHALSVAKRKKQDALYRRERRRRAISLGFDSLEHYEKFLRERLEAEFPSDPKDKPWIDKK